VTRWRRGGGGDRGMVTAELAACLPVLVILIFVGLAAVSVADQRVRAQDAAAEVARADARGDTAVAARLFAQTAPRGATYSVRTDAGQVIVTVTVSTQPVGGLFGHYTVTERAVAAIEPSNTVTSGTPP
jgi:Flp pilus assembly protein TadG